MKYICLGYYDEKYWESLFESERNAMMDECFTYNDVLRKNGHFAGGEALQSPRSAATLRWKNGKVSVTDGPFAETKEQLGGILILEADDLNHMQIQPYLFFDGRCEEAVEFYRRAVDAEVTTLVRFKGSPEPPPDQVPPGWDNKVMHASLQIGNRLVMASSGCGNGELHYNGFSLTLSLADVAWTGYPFPATAETKTAAWVLHSRP